MKIITFEYNVLSFFSYIIMLRTWSKYVHAGVIFPEAKGEPMIDNYGYNLGVNNGLWVLDASESRGDCDWHKDLRAWGSRKIRVYDIPDPQKLGYSYALKWLKGTTYDIMGVLLFGFVDPKKRVYCFEAVRRILLALGTINGKNVREHFSEEIGYTANYLTTKIESLGILPEYVGEAKHYKLP